MLGIVRHLGRKESSRSVVGTGEERAAHPKGPCSSHVWHLPAQPSALPGYQGLILFPTHILLLKSSSLPSMQEVQITPGNALGL